MADLGRTLFGLGLGLAALGLLLMVVARFGGLPLGLGRLPGDDKNVEPVVTVSNGKADIVTLHKIEGTDIWRLVADIASDAGAVCELSAHVAGYDKKLSEIWMFQWVKP